MCQFPKDLGRPQTPASKVDLQGVLFDLHRAPQAPRLAAFREEVASKLQPDSDFDSIILQVAISHYPRPPRPAQAPTQPVELANSARHMWQLFRQMRSLRFTMQGVVQAWRLWVRFSQAHRLHKQRAQSRAKVKRDELLLQAQAAAEAGDMHQVWKMVKVMAPKTKFRKVQLYQNGQIMAPEAELDWIARAFGDRYGSSHSMAPTSLQREHPPLHIDEAEVRSALRQIPARKAVPPNVLPSAFWKACAEQLATPLTMAVNQEWQAAQVWIRQDWADANVALLPKMKQAKTPLELRPIGLQHPLGKTMMKILIGQARQQIADIVKRWPQTAYVPGRSTATALKVVLSHCALIRSRCATARANLHQKHEGLTTAAQRMPLRGGLQVSLDLTAAFDLVNWSHLREALALAQLDPSVQELLLQWLRQVVYYFNHRGQQTKVRPSWGLRQGCPASPVLWSVFTALLCQAFDSRLQAGWAAQHAVMYADDSHLRWQFDTYEGFERALTELRIIMRIFSRFDMCINCKKTQAILLLSGPDKQRVHKHYVRAHPEGKRLLLLPGDPGRWLPLVDRAEYLGLIIAYDRFEALSTRHRIAKANQRRWALASILHSRKFGVRYKLQIWRSCVQTTLLYGLHSFGLSPKLYQEVVATSMKHIRAIVADQQHLTGNTHQDIRERFQLATPLVLLCQAHHRELQLLEQDWMTQADWNLHITQSLLSLRQERKEDVSTTEQECWACPECDDTFPTAAALKIHAQRTHGRRDEPRPIFDKARHAIGGLPTCRFCCKKFSRWQTLQHHIDTMACKVFEPTTVAPDDPSPPDNALSDDTKASEVILLPTSSRPDVPPVAQQLHVQKMAGAGLNSLLPLKQLGRHLQQHCALCGQWVASQKVMKLHYRHTHPEIFPEKHKKILGLINRCATPCFRCHYCDNTHKDWRAHLHKCTTVWQYSVLCVLQETGHELPGAGSGDGRVLRHCQEGHDARSARSPGARGSSEKATGDGDATKQVVGLGCGLMGEHVTAHGLSRPLRQRSLVDLCRSSSTQARGRAEAVATGYDNGAMVQPGPGLSAAFLVPDSSDLQEETTNGANMGASTCATEAGHGNGDVQRTSRKVYQSPPEPRTPQEGHGHGMAGQSGVGVSTLESSTETSRTRPPQGPGDGCRDDQQARVFHHTSQKRCGASLPLHPKAHGDHGLKGHFPSGPVGPEQTCRGDLGSDDGASGQYSVPAYRAGIQAGAPGPWSGSAEGLRHAQIIVRHIFENEGNQCYMNAAVQVLTWSQHCSGQLASGPGAHFFSQIATIHDHVDLRKLSIWGDVLSGWAEAHRQHDICEFLGHVLHRLQLDLFQGIWQARQLATYRGAARCIDHGTGAQPIPLHFPSRPPGLRISLQVQQLVDCWQLNNDRTVGFLAPPSAIAFQLMRFKRVRGVTTKDRTEVYFDFTINIPIFADDRLDRTFQQYSLVSYVVHHGLTPQSGHYTAHLLQDGEFWHCDDHRPAILASAPQPGHTRDSYLLLYARQQD